MILDDINYKLDLIMQFMDTLPEWTALTNVLAHEKGYRTVDGLRKWCYNNLSPEEFEKKGRFWYIKTLSLSKIKRRKKDETGYN